MSRKSFNWYINNGCELQRPSMGTFVLVYQKSGGDPCRECNCKDTCKAWPLINHPTSKLQPASSAKVETNADIAARLGISKRQVAKLRKAGKL